jgi:hypothetical protein
VHGSLDISDVVLDYSGKQEVMECKIKNFQTGSNQLLLETKDSNFWPFSKNKRTALTKEEKFEKLKLKDIYSVGVCMFELLIGRSSPSHFSIALDAVPLIWAEYESTGPLIQVLQECLMLDSNSVSAGKLKSISEILIKGYKKYFKQHIYAM